MVVDEAVLAQHSRWGPLEFLVGGDNLRTALARGAGAWMATVALLATTAGLLVHVPGFRSTAILLVSGLGLALSLLFMWVGTRPPLGITFGWALVVYPATVAVVGLAGPHVGEAAAVIPALVSTAWVWFPPRWALLAFTVTAGSYAVVLESFSSTSYRGMRWAFVIGVAAATSVLFRWLVVQAERLARSERRAQAKLEAAHDELAEWAHRLEARVDEQVAQIQALSQLRRFLSPQVADAVIRSAESGSDQLLRPHRREIAVFFCDLRGFTAFVAAVEPEEAIAVLDAYYRTLGAAINEFQATVGQFAGDGIMAYFNDPLPTDDPARAAVDMALALQPAIRDLVTSWRRRGYDLGYGMGIALGHATLGTIGFESRYDYTPVGSVVNLASRLCSEARHDQILIDHRTRTQIDGAAVAEPILLRLKGFDQDVHAFSLTAPATAGTNG